MMEPQSYTPQTCLGRRVTVESLDRQAQRNSVVSPRDAVPVERSGCSNSLDNPYVDRLCTDAQMQFTDSYAHRFPSGIGHNVQQGTSPQDFADAVIEARRLAAVAALKWVVLGGDDAGSIRRQRPAHDSDRRRESPRGRAMVIRCVFCVNTDCAARVFAEQVNGPATKRARRTNQLTATLTTIGLSLAAPHARVHQRPSAPTHPVSPRTPA